MIDLPHSLFLDFRLFIEEQLTWVDDVRPKKKKPRQVLQSSFRCFTTCNTYTLFSNPFVLDLMSKLSY